MDEVIKKLWRYALYATLFLLPLQTRWIIRAGSLNGAYWEYGTLSLYATDLFLAGLLALMFFITPLRQALIRTLRTDRAIWAFMALIAVGALSVIFAADKAAAWSQIFQLTAAFVLWLAIVAGAQAGAVRPRRLGLWFVGGATLAAVFGVVQFLLQASWANKWLGLAAHPVLAWGTSVVETPVGRWLRAYGPLDHPNVLGGLCAVAALMALGLLVERFEHRFWRFPVDPDHGGRWQTHVLLAAFPVLVTGLIVSWSRWAWLGFGFGFALMLVGNLRQRRLVALKKSLQLLIAIGLLGAIFASAYPELFRTRISAQGRLEAKSLAERSSGVGEAVEIWKSNVIIGAGVGNYTKISNFQFPISNKNTQYSNTILPLSISQPVHSTYLLILAEQGIVGMIAIVLLLITIYLSLRKKSGHDFAGLALYFVILFLLLGDHWWWSIHYGKLMLFGMLGIVYAKNK